MSREIIMDHADHGAHVVYSAGEAADMEKKGWLKRPSVNTPDKALALLGLERDGDKIVPAKAAEPDVQAVEDAALTPKGPFRKKKA